MDRQIAIGNRVVQSKMLQKQRKRLNERLKYIKNNKSHFSSRPFMKNHKQVSMFSQSKNLQIQRQNIFIFNRIASILKQKPKTSPNKTAVFVKSIETASLKQLKEKQILNQENKILQQRLNKQKPTIKNNELLKQRMRHQRYLKAMGRFPFLGSRRTKTQLGLDQNLNVHTSHSSLKAIKYENKQLFRKKTLDFIIILRCQNEEFIFKITDQYSLKQYTLKMNKQQFQQCFALANQDYQSMIPKLRLDNNGHIRYVK